MAGLRDFPFRIFYDASDDRVNDFYVPALSRSVRFDRIAGFFSSAALAVAATGIARLIANDGRMRLLCGAQLSPDDVEAIRRGEELKGVVAKAMVGCLADPSDDTVRARLEALAWMVASGTLEIRVVLPRGRDGLPLPAATAREYFHPKEGLFEDAAGDKLAFSGSCNESVTSWQWNYEVFSVYATFPLGDGPDATPALPLYVASVERRFHDLWTGQQTDWIAIDIPEAARRELLKYAPLTRPRQDPLEKPQTDSAAPVAIPELDSAALARDEAMRAFLREAPFLPNAERLGIDTSPVVPWLHQERTILEACRRYPESFLFADEVGLGKTIEAGLALRSLVLAGRVRRALILAPASVLRQWQEELWEKAALDVPRFDGVEVVDAKGSPLVTTGSIWGSHELLLASSQLAKRRDRQTEILDAGNWDLVIIDEAHHARRKDFLDPRFRPNRLLELLGGVDSRRGLIDRTRCLYLLTATPMQIDPVEVWDLLRLLRVGGRWQADQDAFLAYYREMRKPPDTADWSFILSMLRDYFRSGGELAPGFEERAKARLGPVEWSVVKDLPSAPRPWATIAKLSTAARDFLHEMAERHTPLRAVMWRSTRPLLRRYHEMGLLTERAPTRQPRSEWIALTEGPNGERELYERIEQYISDFYRKYESERKGLGFIMTVYRRRLTSSFAALEKSLDRRRDFLRGQRADLGLTDDDLEQGDLDSDVAEELDAPAEERAHFLRELEYVEQFLRDLAALSSDSKLDKLFQDFEEILKRRDTVLVFTQYTDTMDYLRDRLRGVFGSAVACYSGRGGEVWDGVAWARRSKEELKGSFRQGDVKILLATEAASEGLNLQTCGVLINYDMPWNPMRVEQRIGRIDRIGQRFETVWIRNYFIADTVEALVYHRLEDRIEWFENVVGDLQPILAKISRTIERLSMTDPKHRPAELDEAVKKLEHELDAKETSGIPLDPELEILPLEPPAPSSPVTLKDLEEVLTSSPRLGDLFERESDDGRIWRLRIGSRTERVTFDRAAFDSMPESVTLLTYGTKLLSRLLSQGGSGDGARAGVLEVKSKEESGLSLFATKGDPIRSIGDLRQALDSATDEPDETEVQHAKDLFVQEARRRRSARAAASSRRRQGEEQYLKAEAGDILAEAAYLKLVEGSPAGTEIKKAMLGPRVVQRLGDEGVPFKGLLHLVGSELPILSAESPRLAPMKQLRAHEVPARWNILRQAGVSLLTRKKALDTTPSIQEISLPEFRWLGRAAPPAQTRPAHRFQLRPGREVRPYENAVPVLDLAAAAGAFGGGASGEPLLDRIDPSEISWYVLDRAGGLRDLFVARVVGRSMDQRIPEGSYCLFRASPAGTRNGEVVLCELLDTTDPETGSRFTVKVYRSEKKADPEGGWRHSRITLSPDSTARGFEPIVIEGNADERLRVLGRLVEVLGFPEAGVDPED